MNKEINDTTDALIDIHERLNKVNNDIIMAKDELIAEQKEMIELLKERLKAGI